MTSRLWTDNEKLRLRRMAKTMTAKAIGAELDRTERAVFHAARGMGIRLTKTGERSPNAKHPDALVKLIRAKYSTGKWTASALASEYGVRFRTVEAYVMHRIRR